VAVSEVVVAIEVVVLDEVAEDLHMVVAAEAVAVVVIEVEVVAVSEVVGEAEEGAEVAEAVLVE